MYNLVKRATYRKNTILLEFNEYMHVKKEEHSYLNKANYLLQIGDEYSWIPQNAKIEIIREGFDIRIIFPLNHASSIKNIDNIYLGYVYKNKFRYIESFKGNIQNISIPICLGKEIKILNIEEGIAEIINENTLKYVYTGENKFYSIKLSDFYINKSNNKYLPTSIKKEKNIIVYEFEQNIFYEFDSDIIFNVINNPKSKDMYNMSIRGNTKIKVKNGIPTYVKSLSVSDYKEGDYYFKLYFSAPLNNFCDKDFLIQHNKILYKCFYEDVNNNKTIVYVKCCNIKTQSVLTDKFKLILLRGIDNKIKTLDYKNQEIILKKEIISSAFISCAIEWIKTSYNISGSIIRIRFQRYINPNTIITNLNFNNELNFWNGDEIEIPSQALVIENKGKLSKLSLKNNESFGEILINCVENMAFINKTIYNKQPCFLNLNGSELSIQFNDYEKSIVDFLAVKSIYYNPGENIRDLNNNFIFSGYHPIKYETLGNIIYVEPLKDEEKNPFKGGVKNSNFVITVSNDCTFRYYGINEINTVINGFVKIVGNLNPNQSIVFRNIKILKNIYLNIGESNIVFEKIECNNLIRE